MSSAPLSFRPSLAELLAIVRPPPWFAYVLRVWIATAATLWLAFAFELPTPYSAVTTVFIVANPVRGAIVSKSAWRLVGTAVGAVAAVVQFALFAQSPILFDLFLALWVGVGCGLSTLLRFFRSYGAVLAGYTVVIIDVGAFSSPDRVLDVALDRVSVVTLGIVVTGLVFLLTQPARPPTAFGADIAGSAIRLARLIHDAIDGLGLDQLRARRRALALEISGYEEAITYASADDLDVRAESRALRVAIVELLAALTDGLSAALLIQSAAEHDAAPLADVQGRLSSTMSALVDTIESDRARARAVLRQAEADLASMRERGGSLDTIACAELARLTVERITNVLLDLDPAAGPGRRVVRLRTYLDWSSACRNAIRGGLCVLIACLFWYVTYWPAGPTLLAYLVPAAGLLATLPSPGAGALRFVQGTIPAVPAAIIVQAVLLPRLTDFIPVVTLLLLFTAPGIAFQLSPVWGRAAFSYLVFFNTNLSLDNEMSFDLPRLLSNAEAYILGCVGLLLTFRILIPPNPAQAVRKITFALGHEGERLARARRLPDPLVWENRQVQRILLVGQRLDAMGSTRRGPLIEDATAGMIFGRIVMRLRGILQAGHVGQTSLAAARDGVAACAQLRRDPADCARRLDEAARRVLADEPAPDRLRLAALLRISGLLVEAHTRFFDRELRLDDLGAPVGAV